MPFKYNEKSDKEWFMIPLHNGCPISRAWIQDYARCMNVTADVWVQDALVWFMHECDRQGAHGSREYLYPKAEKKEIAPWRIRISETLYGWADKLAGLEDVGNP